MRRPLFSPTIITVLLSAVAIAGYVAYRLAVQPAPTALPTAAAISAGNPDPQQQLVDTLPTFTLQNMAGEPQSITTLTGKPMLINFWATWCGPCRREIPMLKKVQKNNPSIQIVGIAVDNRQAVLKYAKTMQFNYPIFMGMADAMQAARSFGIDFYALPFTVFVDASGDVLGVHTGELHSAQVDKVLAIFQRMGQDTISAATARQQIAKAL